MQYLEGNDDHDDHDDHDGGREQANAVGQALCQKSFVQAVSGKSWRRIVMG